MIIVDYYTRKLFTVHLIPWILSFSTIYFKQFQSHLIGLQSDLQKFSKHTTANNTSQYFNFCLKVSFLISINIYFNQHFCHQTPINEDFFLPKSNFFPFIKFKWASSKRFKIDSLQKLKRWDIFFYEVYTVSILNQIL